MTPNVVDKNITYYVTVPENTSPGDYLFDGNVTTTSITKSIAGDNSINLPAPPLPPLPPLPVSVARDLPVATLKNTTFEVTLIVDVNESNKPNGYGITETAPSGWNISNVTAPNNLTVTVNGNTLSLVFMTPNVVDKNITYYVTVPESETEGTYSFNGFVQITAGNRSISGDQNISVVGDNVRPISTITFPVNGSYLKACTTINGTAADDNSGVQKVEVSINGTWYLVNGTNTWSYDCSSLTDGTYNIDSRATDNANNVEIPTQKREITIDRVNPELNVTLPVDGRMYVNNTTPPNVNVVGTVSDVNFKNLTIKVNNVLKSTITTAGAFNQSVDLTVGVNNTITVTAIDKAGNNATTTRTVELCGKGDYECNGAVDNRDFMRFAAAFGVTPAASWADFDNDGDVDNADFFAFANAWTG